MQQKSKSSLMALSVLYPSPAYSQAASKTKTNAQKLMKNNGHSLLSFETASQLGLIHIINAVSSTRQSMADEYIDSFPELFTRIGKLENLQVKTTRTTIQVQPHRCMPFHIWHKVKAELQKPWKWWQNRKGDRTSTLGVSNCDTSKTKRSQYGQNLVNMR